MVYRSVVKKTKRKLLFISVFISFQIQRMVISGGNFKPDTLKPKEVVSLLLDDDEIGSKCKCSLFLFYKLESAFDCTLFWAHDKVTKVL